MVVRGNGLGVGEAILGTELELDSRGVNSSLRWAFLFSVVNVILQSADIAVTRWLDQV